ncbi:MAG TPA: MBL fold metallo-hydrolase [Patescibacteria group bacterium]|nr:MBL fold metallo-hydrolase [Patescibacteria group bacterium]
MHINWIGQTCVRLQTKNLDEDVVVIIDPYKPDQGDFPRSLSPQIATYSKGQEGSVTMSQNPFIMDTLGEVEVKGVLVNAFASPDDNIIFKIVIENLNVVHLGRLTKKLENGNLEPIMSPDVLLIPVGGNGTYLDPEIAADLVTALEPRIIIPIAYHSDTDPKALPVENFIKQVGLKPESTEKKLILKKKDLPQEETKLYILEKNY